MQNPFGVWIRQSGLTKHAVASLWGVQDSAIWKLTRPGYRPHRENLIRIWRFTGGAVTPDQMLLDGERHPERSPEHKAAIRAMFLAAKRKEAENAKRKTKRKPGTQARHQRSRRRAEGQAVHQRNRPVGVDDQAEG